MSQWNVNNWHWEEVNHTEWATSRIKELYEDYKYVKEGIELTTKVDSVNGNVFINFRKGKKIHGYDLKLTLKFKATDLETYNTADGEIVFTDLDDYSSLDDAKITFKFKKDHKEEPTSQKEFMEKVKSLFTVETFLDNFKIFLEEFKTK